MFRKGLLKNIGNVTRYKAVPQTATPFESFIAQDVSYAKDSLAVKCYLMLPPGLKPRSDTYVSELHNFLQASFNDTKINPQLGLGFAILSKNMLNVAMWDKDYPIGLKTNLYSYDPEQGFPETVHSLDISKVGPFCVWELGIVHHERNAWIKYLQSKRKEADKRRYINSKISGSLDLPK